MIAKYTAVFVALSAPALAGPVYRLVDALDADAFDKAQQRDDSATRTFSDVNIKTTEGKCLFVDQLSGDSAANLTPIQVAACGATDGQGFDVITQGAHNDAANSILIVSTLTQACFTFDPSQATGKQVMLYSCGGVADGSGNSTTSQLFAGDGSATTVSLAPENQPASCFTVKGNSVEIADCDASNTAQTFTFVEAASESDGSVDVPASGEDNNLTTAISASQATVTVTESVTVTVVPEEAASTDVTLTTTVFVTVGFSSTVEDVPSSTATLLITIPSATATEATSAASPSSGPQSSSRVPSDPNTIPQISINPSTTVVQSGVKPSSAVSTSAAAPSEATSAAIDVTSSAPPQASSKAPADTNTIPQISINPTTTAVVASGVGQTSTAAATSAPSTAAAAPSSKALADTATIPRLSISPHTTVVVS